MSEKIEEDKNERKRSIKEETLNLFNISNDQINEEITNVNETNVFNDSNITFENVMNQQCGKVVENKTYQQSLQHSKQQECKINLGSSIPVQKILVYDTPQGNPQFGAGQPGNQGGFNQGPLSDDNFSGINIAEASKEDRQSFIKKVFAVLLTMLIASSALLLLIYFSPLREIFRKNFFLMIMCVICGAIITMSVGYAFMCSSCTKYPPMNYVMLLLIVIGYVLTGIPLICKYRYEVIIYAFIATSILVAMCLGLAFTNVDFTKAFFVIVMAMMAVMVCSFIITIIQFATQEKLTVAKMAIMIIFCVLQCVMLIIELQMVLGGKQMELSTDMWAFGAFLLYTSIMNLFYHLVALIGASD